MKRKVNGTSDTTGEVHRPDAGESAATSGSGIFVFVFFGNVVLEMNELIVLGRYKGIHSGTFFLF